MSARKQKRFRVTATVTFARPVTMAQARQSLSRFYGGKELWFSLASDEADATIRGPFQASPFDRKIRK